MDKKYRLTKIKLDEVSLVGSGDDARANVVLSKSDSVEGESDSIPRSQLGGNGMGRKQGTPAIIDKSALPDDVREYIDTLEEVILAKDDDDNAPDGDANDFEDEVDDEYEDEDGEVEDDDDTDQDDHEDAPPAKGRGVKVGKSSRQGGEAEMRKVLAKADPQVRDLITKMESRIAKAEAIAKHERDEREKREWIAKASTLTHINDRPDELGGLLKSLNDKAPAEAAAIEKLLRAANAQVAKSGIWDEIGRSSAEVVGGTLDMKATELRKADPSLTREQAEARALDLDPSLYDEYLAGN